MSAEHRFAQAHLRRQLRDLVRGLTEAEVIDALFRDPATGLLNRRAFGRGRSQMVAIVDVDSLKWVNDHDGHEAGDELLRALAGELVKAFGGHRVFRLAGDEFVVRGDSAAEIILTLQSVRGVFRAFSFGVGRDLAAADEALRFEKRQREQRGERAARGERPPLKAIAS